MNALASLPGRLRASPDNPGEVVESTVQPDALIKGGDVSIAIEGRRIDEVMVGFQEANMAQDLRRPGSPEIRPGPEQNADVRAAHIRLVLSGSRLKRQGNSSATGGGNR